MAVDSSCRLYEYCTARLQQPQSISNTKIVQTFIDHYGGRLGASTLVDYIAFQMNRWCSGGTRIMPNMIFGEKAIGRYSGNDDFVNYPRLRRYGIIKRHMLEIVGRKEVGINKSEYNAIVRRKMSVVACSRNGVEPDNNLCSQCKNASVCLETLD